MASQTPQPGQLRRVPVALPERYSVSHFIAAGGMASVWAAHDELLGRDVAIKVVAEHVAADEGSLRRFQREARTAASLSSHTHVVTIYDVGEHDGRAFIVMELFRGGTVADVLRDGVRVRRDLALRWLAEAGSALDAAHEAGVVHRDVKPANLLLDERGRLAVADFGIARLAGAEQMTASGVVLGTAAYLSPEQALGDPAVAASDRYALACVAYELLCGRRPFSAEHFAAQARQHIEVAPPPATSVDPSLPPALDAVLARGLAKDADARWPSAEDFVHQLRRAFEAPRGDTALFSGPRTDETRVLAPARAHDGHPRASHRAAPPLPPAGPPAAVPGHAPRPGRRRSPALILVPLLLVVALGALVGVLMASQGDDSGERADRRTPTSERERTTTQEREPDRTTSTQAAPAATATATAEATQSPEATATATQTPTPAATQDARPDTSGSASSLNNRGFALYQQGNYADAVPLLQGAVEKCGDSSELDPCGYALFNLGSALHRSGRSAEGIPFLERRLANFNFKNGEVKRELKAARKAAGGA